MNSRGPYSDWSRAAGLQSVTNMRQVASNRKMHASDIIIGKGSVKSKGMLVVFVEILSVVVLNC